MNILVQLSVTYLLLSITAGLVLMIVDVTTDFKWISQRLIVALYIPPLMLIMLGGVAVALFAIWTGRPPL